MTQSFHIHTLHRGKYMLCFFVGLFIAGALCSNLPFIEIYKIVAVLAMVPIILYTAVKWSQQPSTWTLSDQELLIQQEQSILSIPIEEIDHIRSLTRSGGNLYIIYRKKKSPIRIWRNKLFQKDDDHLALHEALSAHPVEYYKF